MNIFEIKCACGGFIMGPREGGKARGRWLGYDACSKCRAAEAGRNEARNAPPGVSIVDQRPATST